jgi:hypothetical protein
LVKTSSTWGQPCEKCEDYKGYQRDYSGVYQVELKNACTEMLEVKLAMQEKNGGTLAHLPGAYPCKPGESMTGFACHGTGKYLYWARRMNDTEIILPSDREIVSAYREK